MGKSLPALRVFSLSIKYLTDHLVGICHDRIAGALAKEDIHWVITVPAIWSDAAKQFMKEAAKEVRFISKCDVNLTLWCLYRIYDTLYFGESDLDK